MATSTMGDNADASKLPAAQAGALEDVESLFGLGGLRGADVVEGGVALHPFQVLVLDPLGDAATAGGQQAAVGRDGYLDHALGRLVGRDRATVQCHSHVIDPD